MPSPGGGNGRGLVVVISGPSGAGKTTICQRLVQRYGYERSVSATTRAPRPGESDGAAYRFLTRDAFMDGVRRDEFLEYSEHFDNLYGTPRKPVEAALNEGRTILLEIDVNGARQVMERMPGAFCVFIAAPDTAEQERRLRGRRSESERAIHARLQRAEMEMAARIRYDARIVNEDVESAVAEIHELIQEAEARKKDGCRTA